MSEIMVKEDINPRDQDLLDRLYNDNKYEVIITKSGLKTEGKNEELIFKVDKKQYNSFRYIKRKIRNEYRTYIRIDNIDDIDDIVRREYDMYFICEDDIYCDDCNISYIERIGLSIYGFDVCGIIERKINSYDFELMSYISG
jgi:hypothetical protein